LNIGLNAHHALTCVTERENQIEVEEQELFCKRDVRYVKRDVRYVKRDVRYITLSGETCDLFRLHIDPLQHATIHYTMH